MVDSIGGGSSLARSAIEAALKRHAESVARATTAVESSGAGAATASNFSSAIVDGLKDVDSQVKRADALVDGIVSGKVQDFHEVAAALKESELALKFSLEVRNKFVDAYREIMRMSV
ncbi:MAG: flagellar hook-basal body complex protein FliE [Planctomycetota bacterium]|nr:flagellar hook-basal body complex protein FliE [Planctomycetota bacterium]